MGNVSGFDNKLMEVLDYLLPLLALVLFILPKRRMKYYVLIFVILYSCVIISGIVNALFFTRLPYALNLSPLASVFAISAVLVGLSVSVYLCGYINEYLSKKSRIEVAFHCFCFLLLFISMIGVLSSSEKFDFLFNWELMSLSSFALILWNGEGNRKALHAALGYLFLMHIGFFLLIFGFCLLPAGQGLMGYGAMPLYIWILFFLGFGIKVGIVPVHGWLPVAHPSAPSHVSAMMSATMLNIGIYGIFRATLGTANVFVIGIILFVVGSVTALFGAYRSAMETNLKTLLAYSSMDNMGIILLGIGLGAIGKAMGSNVLAYCGYCGALIHMLCHSVFKMSLFMCAGSVQQSSGTLNLDSLGGLIAIMPKTGFFFLISVLSAMSIPPLSGFVGEFVILGGIFNSFAESNTIIISFLALLIIAIVVGMTAVSMIKAFSRSILSTPRTPLNRTPHESNTWMLAGLFMAFIFIVLGFFIFPTIILFDSSIICAVADASSIEMFQQSLLRIFILGVVVLGITIVLYKLKKKRGYRYDRTWSCGAADIPQITQVGASSFSSAMSSEVMFEKQIQLSNVAKSRLFSLPDIQHNKFKDVVSADLTRLLARMMHFLSKKIAIIQTGKVYHYVFHALIFMACVFLLSYFGLM